MSGTQSTQYTGTDSACLFYQNVKERGGVGDWREEGRERGKEEGGRGGRKREGRREKGRKGEIKKDGGGMGGRRERGKGEGGRMGGRKERRKEGGRKGGKVRGRGNSSIWVLASGSGTGSLPMGQRTCNISRWAWEEAAGGRGRQQPKPSLWVPW